MDESIFPVETGARAPRGRPYRRRSLHEQVVTTLRTIVLEGRIPPGTRVPETALCEELDISRTPLREALKVLASEGLVELLPNRGALTTQVTVAETRDLFQVMVSLESLVGRLVATTAEAESIAEIEAMHSRLADFHQRRRRADYFRLNQQIHKSLARATANAILVQTYGSLSDKVRRARYLANLTDERWDASMQEHEGIMIALRRRDPEALASALADHMAETGEAVIAALQRIAVDEGRRNDAPRPSGGLFR